MNSPSDTDHALRALACIHCGRVLDEPGSCCDYALAAAEAAPLDVERLYLAVGAVETDHPGLEPGIVGLEWEKAVAREYAALAATSREGEGG